MNAPRLNILLCLSLLVLSIAVPADAVKKSSTSKSSSSSSSSSSKTSSVLHNTSALNRRRGSGSLEDYQIAIIVICVVIAIIVTGVVIGVYLYRKSRRRQKEENEMKPDPTWPAGDVSASANDNDNMNGYPPQYGLQPSVAPPSAPPVYAYSNGVDNPPQYGDIHQPPQAQVFHTTTKEDHNIDVPDNFNSDRKNRKSKKLSLGYL